MTTTTTKQLDQLVQFTGTEQVFRHALVPTITFTEGAKYVADQAGAYWLLDEIALAQRFEAAVQPEPFQLWVLTVHEKCRATLVCEDGDGITLYTRAIGFTDFPAPGIRLYLCDGVILLPSEYRPQAGTLAPASVPTPAKQENEPAMVDLDAIAHPMPSRAKPTAFTVMLRRHRADRFELRAVTVRLFAGGMIGGWGFAATAAQNPD